MKFVILALILALPGVSMATDLAKCNGAYIVHADNAESIGLVEGLLMSGVKAEVLLFQPISETGGVTYVVDASARSKEADAVAVLNVASALEGVTVDCNSTLGF